MTKLEDVGIDRRGVWWRAYCEAIRGNSSVNFTDLDQETCAGLVCKFAKFVANIAVKDFEEEFQGGDRERRRTD